MKTITVCNQKGGAGKTTTAAALAAGLSRKGYKVLAVDLDPQHNLTAVFAPAAVAKTIMDVIAGKPTAEVLQKTGSGFNILPGSLDLAIPPEKYTLESLKGILGQIERFYDYCIIDTPPALSVLTMSALVASDMVVIPAQAEIYSLYGLDQITETVDAVRPYNPGLKIMGILLNRYNSRRNLDKTMLEVMEQKARDMGTRIFSQTIRTGVAIQEAPLLRQDIFTASPRAGVTLDYDAFITELLKGDM